MCLVGQVLSKTALHFNLANGSRCEASYGHVETDCTPRVKTVRNLELVAFLSVAPLAYVYTHPSLAQIFSGSVEFQVMAIKRGIW